MLSAPLANSVPAISGSPPSPSAVFWKRHLRLWREGIEARAVRLDAMLASGVFRAHIRDFALKSSPKGRARALAALKDRLGPVAVFQVAKLDDPSRALWAVIAIAIDQVSGNASVDFLVISRGKVSRGLWRLKVQPHAQERFFQRNPGGDLTRAMLMAHDAIGVNRVHGCEDRMEVLVETPDGCFSGELIEPPNGERYIYARTWLRYDQRVIERTGLVIAPAA